ncbi:putative S-adenosylmethionine-dependent methyltransferase 2 [Paramagnetospirillum magnetotacticum MS-1]|uniref:Putative S-adenosylmethionine-dependent methyltransferase 2 n=1 Tax=Paramagnetospirillum magnetotacticum MS-1 TaxID=272627 RepID=A0A0C2UY46_PARME|nr:class I SAM-dependent methyltransferase [Paramagnetospirillum magnetotacticum]KIL97731.1 putative S-adenosylmethionine-dependent methyltransferase 2 [Paramagnetospirillum magnetotacticum MS-1]
MRSPVATMTDSLLLSLLRCPRSGEPLRAEGETALVAEPSGRRYRVSGGVPLLAEDGIGHDAQVQQQHYDGVAAAYVENLSYPHTQEYLAYLDQMLETVVEGRPIGIAAEICCGSGEAFRQFGERMAQGIGIDISANMLGAARASFPDPRFLFVQGDANRLPLADSCLDTVFMVGGVHHINDRRALFSEIHRVLKPGGRFYWREPVSDFLPWRMIRWVIYRLAPALDHLTERPLRYHDTVPLLKELGFGVEAWKTCGFLGFCFLMNSDVLVFNRLFRFLPNIRDLSRALIRLDHAMTSTRLLSRQGLIVVGAAAKPEGSS